VPQLYRLLRLSHVLLARFRHLLILVHQKAVLLLQYLDLFLVVVFHLLAQCLTPVEHILVPPMHLNLVLELSMFPVEVNVLVLECFLHFCLLIELPFANR
jgi:hypothetical protein